MNNPDRNSNHLFRNNHFRHIVHQHIADRHIEVAVLVEERGYKPLPSLYCYKRHHQYWHFAAQALAQSKT
ncbi:hypothetical protein [Pedobacter sp. V48]|uniref:hypothetical protein n=1 Tax=Pedobacter sp. V48 TaxID=509635 RepID=UPI001377A198|nr:hypothetical protein [Pedobacter sp. V48]